MLRPTPADSLLIKLLAEIQIDVSEAVLPIRATKDIPKFWPNIVKETDPETGVV
jgi:hypothetical protein